MRPKILLPLLAVVCLFSAVAQADSLDRISPSSVFAFSAEVEFTVYGSGLQGSDHSEIVFSGPAGTFSQFSEGDGSSLSTFIPDPVLLEPGQYAITVHAYDVTGGLRIIGPKFLDVVSRPVTDPPLINTPENVTAEATNSDGASVTFVVTAFSYVDPNAAATCDRPSGSNFPIGTTRVTCSVTDANGSAQGIFSVIVADTTPPVLTLPSGISSMNEVVTYSASAVDNIDGPVAVSCSPTSGSTFPTGTTWVECSAEDLHNNFGRGRFPVSVNAPAPPVINFPADFSLEATGSNGAFVTYVVTTNGNTLDCTPPSDIDFPLDQTTVNCVATDTFGGITTGSFHVTVTDTTRPVLTLPADITVLATSGSGAIVDYTASATDIVDVSVPVSCSHDSGTLFPMGTTTVNCTAADLHGNSATGSFHVTVNSPTPPPVLVLPSNFNAEATSAAGAVVTYAASATDGTPVSCSPISGSTFPFGPTTVHCQATNPGGTTLGSFQITVRDTTAPSITVPTTITVEATGAAGRVVTYSASATDTVDGSVTPSCTPASGATFPIATTTVQCTATDAHGNAANASFSVIVRDTTAPALMLPGTITAEATSAAGRAVSYAATATDAVDGSVTVNCAPPSGSTFAIATTAVACSATDAHGNSSSGSFSIIIRDTTPPALTLPANISKQATSTAGATVTYTATATDLVNGNVPVTCTPASGSNFPFGTTTVNCNASDSRGNSSSGSFTVTVSDTSGPVLNLPGTIVSEAWTAFGSLVFYNVTAVDAVYGTRPVSCSPGSPSLFPIGTSMVTCTSNDGHGNSSTGAFAVIVQDTTDPWVFDIYATPNTLWPADNQLKTVQITVVALDLLGDPLPSSHIVSVTSSQPPLPGQSDYTITGPLTVKLRASRTNNVDRKYTITVETTDAHNNTTTSSEDVWVSHSKHRGSNN
jgi:hypothetical protein